MRGVCLCLVVALVVGLSQARTASHLMWETSLAPTHEIYGWTQGKKANPDEVVKMTVAVKQQNTEHITKLLEQVSDPKSSQYGKYLSMEEVGNIIRPTPEAISTVSSWLKELGCVKVMFTPNSNWARCVTRVGAVERAIPSAKFYVFEHQHRSKPLVRSMGAFEVNVEVAKHVDIISGISDFPPVKQRKEHPVSSPQADDWSFRPSGGDSVMSVSIHYPNSLEAPQTFVLSIQQELSNVSFTFEASSVKVGDESYELNALGLMNSDAQVTLNVTTNSGVSSKSYESPVAVAPWVTASLVRSLYDIPDGLVSQFPNNSQAVAEFDEQYYSPSDLKQFTQLMGIPLPEVDLQGSNDPTNPGVESTLDIQWIITTGSNITTTFWYVESGFLTEWALEVSADPNPPLVHSISYGEPETVVTSDTLDRLNSEFQQLGLRGVTIISTSGDIGVSDGFPRGCNSDTPDFPSSSPWTTSLGASALARDYTTPFCTTDQEISGSPIVCAFNAEVPCSAGTGQGFTTGGGFSYKNPQPSYQTEVVTQYLNSTSDIPPSSWFNEAGRGFNDVTALGSNIVIIYNGAYAVTGGTSASGPIVAGLLALINDSLLSAGKASLGFANPFLYATATDPNYVGAFNPITIGDNKCKELGTDGAASCCQYGFSSSSTVWDPVNGLGSPNFQTLRRAALDFQS